MDDNPLAFRYTATRVTRREGKTVVLTAMERSGRGLTLRAAGEHVRQRVERLRLETSG